MDTAHTLRRLQTAVSRPEYCCLAAISLLIFVTTFGWRHATGDEAVWHYIGFSWVKLGVPPYRGTVDNKGPGIFLLYALSSLLFGVNFLIPRIAGWIAELVTALALYHLGR